MNIGFIVVARLFQNALLQNYRKLQLTADECLLIAWLMQRHPEEPFVLNIPETCQQF